MPVEKMKLFLYAESDNDPENASGMMLSLITDNHKFLMSDEAINLGEITVRYNKPKDLTEDSLRRMAIETLQKKQESERAKAYRREQELQRKIDKLLLLTHTNHEVVA